MGTPRTTDRARVEGASFADGWPVWRRWWYAAKPDSWPKLLVPTLLGQALGLAVAAHTVAWSVGLVAWVSNGGGGFGS